jgi:hypothetical protein
MSRLADPNDSLPAIVSENVTISGRLQSSGSSKKTEPLYKDGGLTVK